METLAAPSPPATLAPAVTRLLSLPTVLVAAILVLVFLFVPRTMADPDIWWHLRDAQLQLATHHFITRDVFSFTAANSPWMDHEWIAELPFYLGWRLAGPTGVYWVTLLAIEINLLGVLFLAWLHSRNLNASILATVIATLLSTVSFGPRTLLFGWICLLTELILLKLAERRPAILWALPPLFLLWVNTHGSWMIGLVLLALYTATSAFPLNLECLVTRRVSTPRLISLLATFFLSFLALFLNPYGWRLVAYPFNLAFHQKLNIANIEEWRSLDFHSPRGLIVLACLFGLALWQLYRPRVWSATELAFLALGIYSAFNYSRFLFLFAILAAPILAKTFPIPTTPSTNRPLINFALLILLLSLVVGNLRSKHPDPHLNASYPTQALPFLATFHPQGRLFHDYLWGGYLTQNLPAIPDFIDSRVDIFEYNGTFKDYLDIVRINNSLALLDKYNIRYVLFNKDTPLVYLLRRTPGWKSIYEDPRVILLENTEHSDLTPNT